MDPEVMAVLTTKLEEVEAQIAARELAFRETIRPLLDEALTYRKMLALTTRGRPRKSSASTSTQKDSKPLRAERAARGRQIIAWMREQGHTGPQNPVRPGAGTRQVAEAIGVTPLEAGTQLGAMARWGRGIEGDKHTGWWAANGEAPD